MPPGLTAYAHRDDLGVLVQPGTRCYLEHYAALFGLWGADNGCFARGEFFDDAAWFAWIATIPAAGCLFVVAPDVVGDPKATWERSAPWLGPIMRLGLPAALCAQDGFEDLTIEWEAFDTIFIGGSTEWKLSQAAADVVAEAKQQGKWTHVGRVNSKKRFRWAADVAGADSADGTFLAFGPTVNLPRMLAWLRDEDEVVQRGESVDPRVAAVARGEQLAGNTAPDPARGGGAPAPLSRRA